MEKFTTLKKISVSGRNLNLLNLPFQQRRREEDFVYGRMSSYHDPYNNEPDWFVYDALMQSEIVIIKSKESFTSIEAMSFMGLNNGIGLTRDNLFMLPSLFPKEIEGCEEIIAPMGQEFLPCHNNGPKILPKLDVITKNRSSTEFGYDWWWCDNEQHQHKKCFAFLKPLIHKPYKQY